ncbi:MAG: carbon storage regulator [Planctomycetota bacterium]
MLVLSRKVGDKVVVDGNITVEVINIQGNRIILGVVAPPNIKILRGELTQTKAEVPMVELAVEDGLLVAC